jgi:aminopeptidase N
LAFIVGELDSLTSSVELKNQDVTVQVHTPPGLSEQANFALDVAVKSIQFLENVFRIPYPLSKVDLAAIPDFDCGAMENWGLITYRMSSLLVDVETSSLSAKQRVAYVVSHELAHQVSI